jgi:hypothetical protein
MGSNQKVIEKRVSMKRTPHAIAALALLALICGCDDRPRKEASLEDICASYKTRLNQAMADPKMTDQDRINMIPRLPGYADCKDTIGTGGLTIPGAPAPGGPSSGPRDESATRGGGAR